MLRTGELPNLGPSKYGPARFSVPRFEALMKALRELDNEFVFVEIEDSPSSRQEAFLFIPVVPLLLDRILKVFGRKTTLTLSFTSEVYSFDPFKKFLGWNSGSPGQYRMGAPGAKNEMVKKISLFPF